MIPLLRSDSSSPFFHQGKLVSTSQMGAAIAALSRELPQHHRVLNLCENRLIFSIGLCAAAAVGLRSLLPPSRAPEVLAAIADENGPCVVLRDYDVDVPKLEAIDVCWDALANQPPASLASVSNEFVALTVYTSGSTGKPAAHHKRWADLVCENRLASSRLFFDREGRAPTIVATVPPQHMFGLATSVFTALQGGNTVHSARPIFPADVASALNDVAAPRILVTTPAHLRVLAKSAVDYPAVEMVLSATAPLSPELAAKAAARFSAEMHEIYGCTEAGSIATRNSVDSEVWAPYPGVEVFQNEGGYIAKGPQLPEPQMLADQLEILGEGWFKLLGRSNDMINVAGKRASLEDLNQKLNALTGVEDGVFWMPSLAAEGGKEPKLLGAVVSALDDSEIQGELARFFDPVFIPRRFTRVAMLPRNENGKLLNSQLEELFDCQ